MLPGKLQYIFADCGLRGRYRNNAVKVQRHFRYLSTAFKLSLKTKSDPLKKKQESRQWSSFSAICFATNHPISQFEREERNWREVEVLTHQHYDFVFYQHSKHKFSRNSVFGGATHVLKHHIGHMFIGHTSPSNNVQLKSSRNCLYSFFFPPAIHLQTTFGGSDKTTQRVYSRVLQILN